MSRRSALAVLGIVLLAESGPAGLEQPQKPQAPPPQIQSQDQGSKQGIPAFRSRVTLVPLDVRVLDRQGKPVTDLRQEDFTILEESAPQVVSHFWAHGLVPEAPPTPRTGPAFRTKPGDAIAPPRGRTFLLVLGRGRLQQPFDGIGALIQFVGERLLPQDHVAVMAYNRATDFTTDHSRIVAVLERFRERHEWIEALLEQYGSGPAPIYKKCKACLPESILPKVNEIFLFPGAIVSREQPQALGEDEDIFGRNRRFYDALLDAALLSTRETTLTDEATLRQAELLGGLSPADYAEGRFIATQDSDKLLNGITTMRYLDGEKHLVFLADRGLSLTSRDEDVIIHRAAADARIALHTIVTGGIRYPSMVGRVSSGMPRAGATDMTPPVHASIDMLPGMAMREMAEATGGLSSVTKYPREAFAAIDDVTRFEYLLGYYPAENTRDGKYRKVEVKVNRPDVTVLVRNGYYADDVIVPTDRAAFIAHQRIAQIGFYRDDVTDLKLTLRASQAKTPDRKVPGDVLVDLTINVSRVAFEVIDGRHVASLDVKVYCGDDRDRVLGELSQRVSLNLTDASYRRYLRNGVPYEARIPVKAQPKRVKAIVYDPGADLAGSVLAQIR